jgi:hypothetical protein
MERREFLKLSLATATLLFTPSIIDADEEVKFDYSLFESVQFDRESFNNNSPQILAIFLAGGSSQLAGNMTNLEDIKRLSESSYPNIEVTENGFWSEAGGLEMESMLSEKKLSIVRTLFREKNNSRSHGLQTAENQTASLDVEKSGFFSDILKILHQNGVFSEDSVIPSVSFTGGTPLIFKRGELDIPSHLNFTSLSSTLDNPFAMKENKHLEDGEESQIQALANSQNGLKLSNSLFKKANENFLRKMELAEYVDNIANQEVTIEFPDNQFGKSMESALKVMNYNSDTRLAFMEFGGWDDHSGAINNYKRRMSDLFGALKSGVDYLTSVDNRHISIWIFTEFGRNVNLNKSLGWDHGNIFNLFVAGHSTNYLELGKIIGQTEIFKPDPDKNRVYMRPTDNSEKYEPYAIASTIEKIFGVTNPELLTEELPIESLLKS